MARSPYHQFSLVELIQIIEHTALDLMNEPITGGVKSDKTVKTMAEVSYENSLVVMENNGIRLMANELVRKLSTEEDDPDG